MEPEVRIFRDSCGCLTALDTFLKKPIRNATGSPVLTKWQAEKIASAYEGFGYKIFWEC